MGRAGGLGHGCVPLKLNKLHKGLQHHSLDTRGLTTELAEWLQVALEAKEAKEPNDKQKLETNNAPV